MTSVQSLSLADRRLVAMWAADCAERVLPLFETEAPDDGRARDAIARTRAFGRGELEAHREIRRRFQAGRAAESATSRTGAAAARSAAQASGVAHMGAHALGAAGYAGVAVGLDRGTDAVDAELQWQLVRMSEPVRRALRSLPPLGLDTMGPLGPGLLARGGLGAHIRRLQDGIG